ncbi:MAG: LysR substrate-binding domain-containing protein [Gammaproteobacteria bacterium]|nr:LysR substrate-binding domain-containing protein [Gammaproteobacteria bacterium]
MDLDLVRSFLAVADCGSITEASGRVNITQPALSRRVRQLEAHFGAELLARGRKGVELTEAGRLVAAEGRILVGRFERLAGEVASLQGLESGTVRIGGGATAVSFILPEAIAAFQRDHPGVRFTLKEAGSAEVARDVAEGALELGVVTLPVGRGDLDIFELGPDAVVLVARRDHPLARRERVEVSELAGHAFVGFEAGSAIRQLIDAALREAGVTMEIVMELRSIPAILRMVETTGNLAFVSRLGLSGQAAVRGDRRRRAEGRAPSRRRVTACPTPVARRGAFAARLAAAWAPG